VRHRDAVNVTKVPAEPATDRPAFPAGSAWDRPGFVLWHATLRWQREVATVLRPLGLTHAQFVMLAGTLWLETNEGSPPSQRELADHAGTDAMMTSQVVRTLEKQGLLVRHADEGDARVRRLATTPKGRKLALRAVNAVEQLDERIFGGADADRLVALLRRIAAD
jgi:DNA-binding MarR family transcriptional regulator